MLHTFFFSPSDTTRKYAKAMTDAFGGESQLIDLTHGSCEIESELIDGDTVLLISPVYAGRIPALAADLFRQIDGHGMRAIVAVVYGNRDYDDALLELADIAVNDGFDVIAAGAFIAQHCIFPKVANGRPDASDMAVAADFMERAKESDCLNISTIKGNRPYKKPGAVPLQPQTDENECVSCGVCAQECPTGAIDPVTSTIKGHCPYKKPGAVPLQPQTDENECVSCGVCARECPTGAIDPVTLATDKNKCITCCRCIAVCGSHARKFKGVKYATVGKIFCEQNSKRREPELFF